MAGTTAFPTALDTTTTLPTAGTLAAVELDGDGTADNVHSNVHGVENAALIAIQTKLGIDASTPAANTVLVGTGAGDSSWSNAPTLAGDLTLLDDIDLAFGTGKDILARNRSTSLSANGSVTDIIIGTRVHPGVAANSLIVSGITASGDMLFLTNRGGNSEAHMLFDASAGDTILYARGVEAVKIAGGGVMTITPALTVTGLITANGGITFPAGADIAFTGTTGTNDITLTDSLADALSITRAGTDMIVFDSNTPQITITPVTTMTGLITSSGGITFPAGADIAFTGTTGTNDITLTDSLADALSITRAGTDMMAFDSSTPNIVITPTVTITGLLTATAGLSAGDNNITNVADIALDTISADATDINVAITGFLGINETVNTKMTLGLTINQGANDDFVLDFKSSDVGHGMTDNAEADTFASFKKVEADSGGLQISGFKDGDGLTGFALLVEGLLGEAADTTDTTTSNAVVQIRGSVESGSTSTGVADDGNLLVIENLVTVRMLLKGDGDLHVTNRSAGAGDVVAAALADDYDDAALIRHDLRTNYGDIGVAISKWDAVVDAHQSDLIKLGVLSSQADFRIVQRYEDLLGAAIWQGAEDIMSVVDAILPILTPKQRLKLTPRIEKRLLALEAS